MIHYQLRCANDHAFDGWFRDSAAFDSQARASLLTCPVCGTASVRRALMAPLVSRGHAIPAEAEPAPTAVVRQGDPPQLGATAVAGGVLPDGVRAVLQRMRAEVEKRCDYVGPGFADEARRIHNGEGEIRGIYGEATPEEAERLAEDGIEIARIPWVPRADG